MKDIAQELLSFSRRFRLDGDLLRCTNCGRGIHISRHLEQMAHSDECALKEYKYPWLDLVETLAEIQQSVPPSASGSEVQ